MPGFVPTVVKSLPLVGMKSKPTVRRVVRSCDTKGGHRGDLEHCPSCDAKFDSDHWIKLAVILVLEIVHGKHGSVVVVGECPKCFKKSWVHQPFSFFKDYHDMYPEDWKKAAMEERMLSGTSAAHVEAAWNSFMGRTA